MVECKKICNFAYKLILTLAFHAIGFSQKLQKSNTSFNRVGNMSPDAKFAVQWRTFKQSVPSRRMVKLAVRFTEKKGGGEQKTLLFNVKNIKIVYITH